MNPPLPFLDPPGPGIDCDRARTLASARLDGELPDATPLDRHLAGCGRCRAYAADLAEARDARSALALAPTPDLWPRIEARARESAAPRSIPALRRRLPRVAAAIAGGVATLLGLRAIEPDTRSHAPGSPQNWIASVFADPAESRLAALRPERRLLAALAAQEESNR